jgi:hypothetical protein
VQPYQRHQFDVLLNDVTERYAAHVVARCDSRAEALRRLRDDSGDDGVRLAEFVDTVFADHRLDDVAGSAFVLQALHRRLVTPEETVAAVLDRLAKSVFADLLTAKVVERLARTEWKK